MQRSGVQNAPVSTIEPVVVDFTRGIRFNGAAPILHKTDAPLAIRNSDVVLQRITDGDSSTGICEVALALDRPPAWSRGVT